MSVETSKMDRDAVEAGTMSEDAMHPAEVRETLEGLAAVVVAGFRIRARHLPALDDWARWNDEPPRTTLRRLAVTASWEVLATHDVWDLDEFRRLTRRKLDALLDASRRIEDDASRMTSLEPEHVSAIGGSPEDELIAEELRVACLDHPDLTDAEHRVLAARIELGEGASGAEIAEHADVTVKSERVMTHSVREVLDDLR